MIWGSCALGFNETCFGFCVVAFGALTELPNREPARPPGEPADATFPSDSSASGASNAGTREEFHSEKNFILFLSGCCIAQRRSLSARSPFCQLKLSEESQIHWKSFSAKATNLKRTTKKNTNHVAVSRRVQGRVGVSLFLGSEEFHSLSSLTMLTTHRQRPPSSLFIF